MNSLPASLSNLNNRTVVSTARGESECSSDSQCASLTPETTTNQTGKHSHAPQPHTEVTVRCCGANVSTHVGTRIRHSNDPRFFNFSCHLKNLSSRPSPKTALCLSVPVSSRTFLDRSTELLSLLLNTSEIPRRFKRFLLKVSVVAFSHLFGNLLKFLLELFFLTCRQFSKVTFRMWAGGAQQLLQIYLKQVADMLYFFLTLCQRPKLTFELFLLARTIAFALNPSTFAPSLPLFAINFPLDRPHLQRSPLEPPTPGPLLTTYKTYRTKPMRTRQGNHSF